MKTLPRSFKNIMLAALIFNGLTACTTASLIGSGIAVGTAADFAVDRRLADAQLDDETIELGVKTRAMSLLKQSGIKSSNTSYSVISYNRKVLLIGQAATPQERAIIEQAARADTKVQNIYNHIHVLPIARTLNNINYDTWVTSKIRTRLLGTKGVYAGHVKVATFNGITYVMGLLTPAQQAAVTQTVRTTTGVRQVVTLYENYYPTNPNQ